MNKRKQDLHLRLVLHSNLYTKLKTEPRIICIRPHATANDSHPTVVYGWKHRCRNYKTHSYRRHMRTAAYLESVPIYDRRNSTLRAYGTCATSPCTRCKNAALQAALRPSPSTAKRSGRHAVKARSSTRSYFPREEVPSMISKETD